MLWATQGNYLITGARQSFLTCCTVKETQHSTTFRISFSIVVGNETSQGNSELRDLGVSRSVDGTTRQFRHAVGQSRDRQLAPRFQAREKNSARVPAVRIRKLNCVAIISHSAPPSHPPSPCTLGVKVTKDVISVRQLC